MIIDVKVGVPNWMKRLFSLASLLSLGFMPISLFLVVVVVYKDDLVYGVSQILITGFLVYPLVAIASQATAWWTLYQQKHRVAFWALYIPRIHLLLTIAVAFIWGQFIINFTDWA